MIRGSGWWSDFWKGICNFFMGIVAPVALVVLALVTPLALPLIATTLSAAALGINVVIQTVSFVVKTGSLMEKVMRYGKD